MDSWIAKANESSSSNSKPRFDVFLNFRGEDTRYNFTSHLDMALRKKGINVFMDYRLVRGEDISASLLEKIEQSAISIVIISENYASSKWCLDELVKIIECTKAKTQVVLPVFYKVDPSHVRNHVGSFGDALTKHDQVKYFNKMQSWKDALANVPSRSGWVLGKEDDEANLIEEIVRVVWTKLNRKRLYLAKFPVGMDSKIQETGLLSYIMSEGTSMVGIYGIGGMGKTTLAKALYNKVADQFEGCCFLADVREASIVKLQEKLLSEILMDKTLKVGDRDSGINIIRQRLGSLKVLILLDDVDKRVQLDALVGERDWFCRGSKIIATTRDKHLLSSHGFDKLHGMQGLDHDKALELFSWHAFKNDHPSNGYINLSKRAVGYCRGHPLALEVLGSFLCNKDDQSLWNKLLDEYEKSSLDEEIRDILRISYDGLEDKEKEIFLDLSCLFIGENIHDVEKILEACYSYIFKGIQKLESLSLLTIEDSKVNMHELIQQMGHTIARSKTSRLWTEKDFIDVLNADSETSEVKAIKLKFPDTRKLDAHAFKNVKNIRMLIVERATFIELNHLEYLPNTLKWIRWHDFPFSSLPPSYTPKFLVGIDLQNSFIVNLWKGCMNCEWLKYVDLSYSLYLTKIPDFSTAVHLEELDLRNCVNLTKVHDSVGFLENLVSLRLDDCSSLKKLPRLLKLKSLKYLGLPYCGFLRRFPRIVREMNSLKTITLCSSSIEVLPESIGYLSGLEELYLDVCLNLNTLPNSIYRLPSLRVLSLRGCSNFHTFPYNCSSPSSSTSCEILHSSFTASSCSNLTHLDLESCDISNSNFIETLSKFAPSLLHLNLSGNSFYSLPSSIVNFTSMRRFEVRDCKWLEAIPKVPTCVNVMDARGCVSLARFPDNIGDMISCKVNFEQCRDYEKNCRVLTLMNSDIPNWYNHSEKYSPENMKISATIRVRHYSRGRKFRALAPCVVFKMDEESREMECKIFINDNMIFRSYRGYFKISPFEYMWLLIVYPPSIEYSGQPYDSKFYSENFLASDWNVFMESDWNDITISFELIGSTKGNIKSCGLHVVEETFLQCS